MPHFVIQPFVSILILLEVPLQHRLSTNYPQVNCLFQSLFYWKYHFNLDLYLANNIMESCFNPYFTGSTTSTIVINNDVLKIIGFQSLFYWKYHFNSGQELIPKKLTECFNPYFTGSTTSTANFTVILEPQHFGDFFDCNKTGIFL